MARILVTGSTDGIGRATADALLEDGHRVVLHARTAERAQTLAALRVQGADVVIGDLSRDQEVQGIINQVESLGGVDVVIHNAGVLEGPILAVNVIAPYRMTAQIPASCHIYLSSSMHRGGRADLGGLESPESEGAYSYSDSKLLVTALMAAVARRWPGVLTHAVDPGWVPTRMGGPSASDDLDLAHRTQVWLARGEDAEVLRSGRYWHHERAEDPHPRVLDTAFQEELLGALARRTGLELPQR